MEYGDWFDFKSRGDFNKIQFLYFQGYERCWTPCFFGKKNLLYLPSHFASLAQLVRAPDC